MVNPIRKIIHDEIFHRKVQTAKAEFVDGVAKLVGFVAEVVVPGLDLGEGEEPPWVISRGLAQVFVLCSSSSAGITRAETAAEQGQNSRAAEQAAAGDSGLYTLL